MPLKNDLTKHDNLLDLTDWHPESLVARITNPFVGDFKSSIHPFITFFDQVDEFFYGNIAVHPSLHDFLTLI